jgi:nucleoside-diphosphate-sugar epimerase
MMRVLVAGATGVIGRPLVRELVAAGHQVMGLSRGPASGEVLTGLGAEPIPADAMDRDCLLRAVQGRQADAVIHQATALKHVKATQRRLRNDPTTALRIHGTANLLAAARLLGARRFLAQSLVLGYGYVDHGTRVLSEPDPFGRPQGSLSDPVLAGLRAIEEQTLHADGIDGIALRYGIFYGPRTFSDLFVDLLRKRRLPLPRGQGGTATWIHVHDAAAATVAALERGRGGQAYNIVDDEPVTWRAFVTALADAYHTPRPLTVPRWLIRFVSPYLAALMVDTSMHVSHAKATRELGWSPATPTYRDGIRALSA